MATAASAENMIVIDTSCRCPCSRTVTGLAHVSRVEMAGRFAAGLNTVMTT